MGVVAINLFFWGSIFFFVGNYNAIGVVDGSTFDD